jgi:hypothetical protein
MSSEVLHTRAKARLKRNDEFRMTNGSFNHAETLARPSYFPSVIRHLSFTMISFAVRYLVKAKVKTGRESQLLQAIDGKTLGRGSVAGDEYLYDMEQARIDDNGVATWVETCFCARPLEEERPYWEQYFHLLQVKDAHSRRNCRHENGTERWACCDCDCTARLEERLASKGEPFLATLRSENL